MNGRDILTIAGAISIDDINTLSRMLGWPDIGDPPRRVKWAQPSRNYLECDEGDRDDLIMSDLASEHAWLEGAPKGHPGLVFESGREPTMGVPSRKVWCVSDFGRKIVRIRHEAERLAGLVSP